MRATCPAAGKHRSLRGDVSPQHPSGATARYPFLYLPAPEPSLVSQACPKWARISGRVLWAARQFVSRSSALMSSDGRRGRCRRPCRLLLLLRVRLAHCVSIGSENTKRWWRQPASAKAHNQWRSGQ